MILISTLRTRQERVARMLAGELPTLSLNATARDAVVFIRRLTKVIGPGFHPDSPAADYVNTEDNQPLFSEGVAKRLDDDEGRCFELLGAVGRDPYAVAIKVQRRLLGIPFPKAE
jgi:hypothetical protein